MQENAWRCIQNITELPCFDKQVDGQFLVDDAMYTFQLYKSKASAFYLGCQNVERIEKSPQVSRLEEWTPKKRISSSMIRIGINMNQTTSIPIIQTGSHSLTPSKINFRISGSWRRMPFHRCRESGRSSGISQLGCLTVLSIFYLIHLSI